jgi:hypothetical protein
MPAIAKADASVSIHIGRFGLKWYNRGAFWNALISVQNAILSSLLSCILPDFLPFLLPYIRAIRGLAIPEYPLINY